MAALGIVQNKTQSELQQAALEKQLHSAYAPEHCVYICNLTYPLGSQRNKLPSLSAPSLASPPCCLIHSQPSCPYYFSPFSLSHSHHHVIPCFFFFFPFALTQRYSQANPPTRFLTLTPIHKHTEGLEDTPMCEDHTVLMCQSHYSLLN